MRHLKKFGLYASTDQEGLWKRTTSYKTMLSAMQAIASVAKQKNRKHKYIIWPNEHSGRYIQFKDTHVEQILKGAR